MAKPQSANSNTMKEAGAIGQSIWLDFIERDLLRSGELARLVDLGLGGLTSNPTIFQKAITEGADYDDDLLKFAQEGRDTFGIYEGLALQDIAEAADILRQVFDRTHGADGYASIEVNPQLAHDTEGTIEEARSLFSRLGRPNVLVKVPATPAGIPAIRTLIGEGVNINVTLIFSRDAYRNVAGAYIDGVADYVAKGKGKPSSLASVASFFVSRVDTAIDKTLPAESPLRGKTAIANAKLAYATYREIFGGDRFAELRKLGARVQRPLWGSTSAKDPAYSDVMYVDGLIGPDTVNTVPPATLKAFLHHGTVAQSLTEGVDEARSHLGALAEAGVDLDDVTDGLLAAGVEAFTESFVDLLECIDRKRHELIAA